MQNNIIEGLDITTQSVATLSGLKAVLQAKIVSTEATKAQVLANINAGKDYNSIQIDNYNQQIAQIDAEITKLSTK